MPRLHSPNTATEIASLATENRPLFRNVMACLDRSPEALRVLEVAAALADMSDAALTVVRVLPEGRFGSPCVDPVDWDLTRREEMADLKALAEMVGSAVDMRTIVTCGSAVRCIQEQAQECGVDVVVLGRGASATSDGWGIGGTAHHVAEAFAGSVLIVPSGTASEPPLRSRVVALLDGSPQSEQALGYASAIAAKRSAELVILHAIPDVRLDGEGGPEPEDAALLRELGQRELRAAENRLRRMRRLVPADAHRSRLRRLTGDDPRRALMKAICEERGELVVLSARGLGRDPDLSIGSTAEYLISRAVSPTLLLRNPTGHPRHAAGSAPNRPVKARGTFHGQS